MKKYYFPAFEISQRTYNCLMCGGINTLEELLNSTKEDLFRIKNLGKKTAIEIENKLKSIGLNLKKEICPFCKSKNTDIKYFLRPWLFRPNEKNYGDWKCLDCLNYFKSNLDWLYDNDYQIVKVKVTTESEGTLEMNPKSKFMEEWGKALLCDESPHDSILKLANLIDKHKADKEG